VVPNSTTSTARYSPFAIMASPPTNPGQSGFRQKAVAVAQPSSRT
jgi:hypothetical protein